MTSMAWISVALLAAVALAGCTQPGEEPPTASATSAAVTRAPDTVAPNSDATVCWRVAGTGTIPHTALHFDNTSHPNSNSFADYAGGASYPNNQSQQAAAGYALPGEFCTNLRVGDEDLYFRAHAMVSAPGVLSQENRIRVRSAAPTILAVTFTGTIPQGAEPNSTVPVCWRVEGSGTIPHTAIHTDTVAHPTATAFTAYPGTPSYPNNQSQQSPAGYDLPGTFCSNVRMPANGTLYMRAHAMIEPPGMISPNERSIAVNGSMEADGLAVTVTFAGETPPNAPAGSMVTMCWRVEGTGTVAHTAVHTDAQSHAADLTASFQSYAGTAYYPGNMSAADPAGYALPGTFCTDVPVPATPGQAVYLRAHVIDRLGAPGKLSPNERSITAT